MLLKKTAIQSEEWKIVIFQKLPDEESLDESLELDESESDEDELEEEELDEAAWGGGRTTLEDGWADGGGLLDFLAAMAVGITELKLKNTVKWINALK